MMQHKNKSVLIVGGGGFLGEHILSALLDAGYETAVLDLFRPNHHAKNVDWIIGSALDEALLASSMSAYHTVVFLAANSLPGSANEDMAAEISSHVRMVVKAAEIASAQGVSKFLFASSGGTVYGPSMDSRLHEGLPMRPINAYGVSKASIEMYLSVLRHVRGMKTTSLRIANPYGVGQRAHRNQGFIAAALAAAITGRVLPCWGDGSVIRDFVYVTDVAAAFAAACAADDLPQEINIGSGIGYSLLEVIDIVKTITGLEIAVEYQNGRNIDSKYNVLDITLAARTLKWRPKTSLQSGIEQTAIWWKETVRN